MVASLLYDQESVHNDVHDRAAEASHEQQGRKEVLVLKGEPARSHDDCPNESCKDNVIDSARTEQRKSVSEEPVDELGCPREHDYSSVLRKHSRSHLVVSEEPVIVRKKPNDHEASVKILQCKRREERSIVVLHPVVVPTAAATFFYLWLVFDRIHSEGSIRIATSG